PSSRFPVRSGARGSRDTSLPPTEPAGHLVRHTNRPLNRGSRPVGSLFRGSTRARGMRRFNVLGVYCLSLGEADDLPCFALRLPGQGPRARDGVDDVVDATSGVPDSFCPFFDTVLSRRCSEPFERSDHVAQRTGVSVSVDRRPRSSFGIWPSASRISTVSAPSAAILITPKLRKLGRTGSERRPCA